MNFMSYIPPDTLAKIKQMIVSIVFRKIKT